MKKYNDIHDDRDNDKNKDGNYDNSTAAGSEYNGLIFELITTPRSHAWGLGNNGKIAAVTEHYIYTR